MAKILILGGGFAALTAADKLSAAAGAENEITLVSSRPEFVFYPALVPMALGSLQPDEIRFDLRQKLTERKIRFVQGEVTWMDPVGRAVGVEGDDIDGALHFDYLIVALGRKLSLDAIPGLTRYAHHLMGVGPAVRFRDAITDFRAGSIVIGLCPDASLPVPVCETALGLASRYRHEVANNDISVTALFPATMDKAFAGAALFRDIQEEFDRAGIRTASDFAVERVEEDRVISTMGGELPYDLLMLVPPFKGQEAVESLLPDGTHEGFVPVNDRLQVNGFETIYAAGDIVSLPGPRFGYMAMRQGRVAASNVLAQLRNVEPTAEYSHKIAWALGEKYTDPVYFHYGFWDETLEDFDDNALFGMAKKIRERYGHIKGADGAAAALS